MRRLLLVAALSLACFRAEAQQADTHAIVGARVVTVSGPVYESATIVMRDGLITAVGPDVKAPAGARVIDGKGLVVTPGLIDGLSAIGLPTPGRAAGGSGTGAAGAAGAGGSSPSPLAPLSLALDRVKAADVAKARDSGITTALVIPKDGVLPGQSVLLNLAGDRLETMVLRQPAALHLQMTTATRQYPGSLMGTMAYTRQALLDAARARDAWAAWEKAPRGQKRPRYDPALAPWQLVLEHKLPLVVTCTLENDARRALALADEFKIDVVLAGAPLAFRTAELLKARRVPLLVSVNFDPPRATSLFGGFDEEQERRRIQDAERNPAELARAGVPFALVSAWAPDFVAGIRRAVEKGLAPGRGAAGGDARRGRGAQDRRLDRQPRGRQARERGGLVGRALRKGHEGALRLRRRSPHRGRGGGQARRGQARGRCGCDGRRRRREAGQGREGRRQAAPAAARALRRRFRPASRSRSRAPRS